MVVFCFRMVFLDLGLIYNVFQTITFIKHFYSTHAASAQKANAIIDLMRFIYDLSVEQISGFSLCELPSFHVDLSCTLSCF